MIGQVCTSICIIIFINKLNSRIFANTNIKCTLSSVIHFTDGRRLINSLIHISARPQFLINCQKLNFLHFSWRIYTCALYFTTQFYDISTLCILALCSTYDTHIRRIRCVLHHKTLRLDETFLLFVGTSSKENEMKMCITLHLVQQLCEQKSILIKVMTKTSSTYLANKS